MLRAIYHCYNNAEREEIDFVLYDATFPQINERWRKFFEDNLAERRHALARVIISDSTIQWLLDNVQGIPAPKHFHGSGQIIYHGELAMTILSIIRYIKLPRTKEVEVGIQPTE